MGDRMRNLNRRQFLRMSAMTVAGLVATSCAPETVVEEKIVEKIVEVTVEPAGIEPPLLAGRVASGELPPVKERLPKVPLMVGGRESIGEYGGEVRLINFDPNWFEHTYGWNTERMLVYSDFDLRTLVPNVIESWEVSDDGTTFTLHLHEGMKWSDGVPVTTEDVAFWWFDYINNDKLGYLRWWWKVGGEPAVLEVLDDYSFTFTFAGPFGSFPAQMTRWFGSYKPILMPKHYMKQFHADYTDEAELNKMAAEVELEGWDALFDSKYEYGITGWYGGATRWSTRRWRPGSLSRIHRRAFTFGSATPTIGRLTSPAISCPTLTICATIM